MMFDPIFTVSNNLKLLKKYIKNQEASYNFKLGFALSNRPHFNSVYLVRVPFLTGIAVCTALQFQSSTIVLSQLHESKVPFNLIKLIHSNFLRGFYSLFISKWFQHSLVMKSKVKSSLTNLQKKGSTRN